MKYLFAGLLLLLTSCAPPKPAGQLKHDQLLPQLSRLPGAVVAATEPASFSYPAEVMFGSYAVLPLPGGPKLLNPLAGFLKQNPQLLWRVDIRAQTGYGAGYDQALAEKRSELLASYLLSKGVDLKGLSFQPAAAVGDQLVFTLKAAETSAN